MTPSWQRRRATEHHTTSAQCPGGCPLRYSALGANNSRAMLSGSRNSRITTRPNVFDPSVPDSILLEHGHRPVQGGVADEDVACTGLHEQVRVRSGLTSSPAPTASRFDLLGEVHLANGVSGSLHRGASTCLGSCGKLDRTRPRHAAFACPTAAATGALV